MRRRAAALAVRVSPYFRTRPAVGKGSGSTSGVGVLKGGVGKQGSRY